MSSLVDFHIHLDCFRDYLLKFKYLDSNKIYTLSVTNLPEIYYRCVETFGHSKYVKFALGYNPQLAGENDFNRVLFDKYLPTTKYIGEVGLDFSKRFSPFKKAQLDSFEYICKKSGISNKLLSIHSRNAEEEVLDVLRRNEIKFAIFHWYTGQPKLIEEIVRLGYYFSINSSMLSNAKGKEIIKSIPIQRIIVESDGPFGKIGGSVITPERLINVYDDFAEFLGVRNLKEVIFDNVRRLLKSQKDVL